MAEVLEKISLSEAPYPAIENDAIMHAESAGLVYVSSNQPGYTRVREGTGFYYLEGRKKLRNKSELERIRKLVLPPAWENVWICKHPKGHLQATGTDKLGRKQYRYHPQWVAIRNQTKFSRLREFGEIIPQIRSRIKNDLSLTGFPQNKVLAAMVSLLERINIRVGNSFYEKLYGSFGLTTLKNHHVKINGTQLNLMFKGKKGVVHNITFKNRRLSRIIQGCKEIPGKELFSYYDDQGNIRTVDSGMVNNYIREISGREFTAKDFRTWAGSIQALSAFKEVGHFETITEMNKKIPAALDIVARQLGNTRAVCKKYYVHPVILELYQGKQLDDYIQDLNKIEAGEVSGEYAAEERALLKILDNYVQNQINTALS